MACLYFYPSNTGTVFVGAGTKRSAYRNIKTFYLNPEARLDRNFTSSDTFNPDCYYPVCILPNLEPFTIRTAITNHFPEYLI